MTIIPNCYTIFRWYITSVYRAFCLEKNKNQKPNQSLS